MDIPRKLKSIILKCLTKSSKAVILYGPRQVGKTTLVKDVIATLKLKSLEINGDEGKFEGILSSRDSKKLSELVEGYDLLFIDEAQRISEIGINLKILIDNHPDLKIIVTGSSSLEIASGISEPLTGRKWTFSLYPIAQIELADLFNKFELGESIEERLIYGSYPDIFNLKGFEVKEKYLRELSRDYLYRDIPKITDIRTPEKINALLKLLSFQVGSQVSLSELGNALAMSKETVSRYIDLLEKSFVLFRLSGFSRNLRKEVVKSHKFYFLDLGIRNAVIDNFSTLSNRNDVGQLWENFLIIERIKSNAYQERGVKSYFWRTYTGAEIDYLEEKDGELSGFELKYNKQGIRPPKTFLSEYTNSSWQLINKENYLKFIT